MVKKKAGALSKKTQEEITDRALQDLTTKLMADSLTNLTNWEKEYGNIFTTELALNFMSRFISVMVYKTLNDRPLDLQDGEELHAYVSANFAGVKMAVQDAVSDSFSSAMTSFTNHPVEYYCQIKPIPEGESGTVN